MKYAFGLAMIAIVSLGLAACGGGEDEASLDQLDSKLGGKGDVDPALTAALEDQIMVDPTLSAQSNEDSIRPPTEPNQGPIPADRDAAVTGSAATASQTLGSLAVEQTNGDNKARFTGCSLDVQYSADWANRLPADVPLYPQARVSEAGGSDNPNCKLRAVTFGTAAAPRALLDFYGAVAKRGGFVVGQKSAGAETTLSGTRAGDGAAFYAIIQPNGTGSSVDLVSNRGQ